MSKEILKPADWKCLIEHEEYLINNLKVDILTESLCDKNVFSLSDKNEIVKHTNIIERRKTFIEKLQFAGRGDTFRQFIECLKEADIPVWEHLFREETFQDLHVIPKFKQAPNVSNSDASQNEIKKKTDITIYQTVSVDYYKQLIQKHETLAVNVECFMKESFIAKEHLIQLIGKHENLALKFDHFVSENNSSIDLQKLFDNLKEDKLRDFVKELKSILKDHYLKLQQELRCYKEDQLKKQQNEIRKFNEGRLEELQKEIQKSKHDSNRQLNIESKNHIDCQEKVRKLHSEHQQQLVVNATHLKEDINKILKSKIVVSHDELKRVVSKLFDDQGRAIQKKIDVGNASSRDAIDKVQRDVRDLKNGTNQLQDDKLKEMKSEIANLSKEIKESKRCNSYDKWFILKMVLLVVLPIFLSEVILPYINIKQNYQTYLTHIVFVVINAILGSGKVSTVVKNDFSLK